jgi:hypothetical protein
LIGWVPGISRPTVLIHVCGLVPAEFLKSFARIVAFLAQALQLAGPEQNGISAMWNNVVGDHCRFYESTREVHGAQGLSA